MFSEASGAQVVFAWVTVPHNMSGRYLPHISADVADVPSADVLRG